MKQFLTKFETNHSTAPRIVSDLDIEDGNREPYIFEDWVVL